jgi:hypothetical protein
VIDTGLTFESPTVSIEGVADDIPPVLGLRWPILVVLDGSGDDEILDLEDRVARHLALSEEARGIVDPDTGRALITQRLMQAIEDLYQAGAVEPDIEGGSIRITDIGRRFSETEAGAIPEVVSVDDETPGPTDPEEPSVGDWIAAVLGTFLG